ncbi:unnamed protein product [Orchesella dallaii]|uniref:Gustatory receptor n=1 Tax=Orchesella dallaii TaxID=48710 RepID=A0ABP1Q528_9HEXA
MDSDIYSEYTAYHMKCINSFRWTALARSVIKRDGSFGYRVKASPILSQLVWYVYLINTVGKLIFLSLLVTDHFGEIEFLDKICGADYILIGVMVLLAYIIWQRYPLYEIIHRLWEIEGRIYISLGCPKEIKWEAQEQHSVTVWSHLILTCVGCCSLTIQFYMAPKYCVFTYSLIEADNSYLRIIFVFHEILFLSHGWSAMACSNGLCSFEAVNLSLIIKKMTEAVNELSKVRRIGDFVEAEKQGTRDQQQQDAKYQYNGRSFPTTPTESQMENKGSGEGAVAQDSRFYSFSGRHKNRGNKGKSGQVSAQLSNSYDFKAILYDFQQLYLASEMFNAWVGYKIVGLSIIAFCQYISSTCMAFQVLRMPGTGITDIWFYIQDCMVAVYVTFRVFDFMAIVLPTSEEFMNSVRKYMAAQRIVNGHIRKFQRTLRPVSLKLGPTPLCREAVLETMEMLSSYYVCVALW